MYAMVKKFNSLPNGKYLDWSKLEAFADKKLNVTFSSLLTLSQRSPGFYVCAVQVF